MEKRYLGVKDIQELFDCGYSKAASIIRSIKAYSNSLPIRGKVLKVDFENWCNRYKMTEGTTNNVEAGC